MLIVLNGLNPSLKRPNLILRESLAKSGCNESKSFKDSPFAGFPKFPYLSHLESCNLISTDVS